MYISIFNASLHLFMDLNSQTSLVDFEFSDNQKTKDKFMSINIYLGINGDLYLSVTNEQVNIIPLSRRNCNLSAFHVQCLLIHPCVQPPRV